jgi:non-heme chloroperoxidase
MAAATKYVPGVTRDAEKTSAQAAAFEKGVPMAHVVRIPHANHYVFRSNEADVLREMNEFLSKLKRD